MNGDAKILKFRHFPPLQFQTAIERAKGSGVAVVSMTFSEIIFQLNHIYSRVIEPQLQDYESSEGEEVQLVRISLGWYDLLFCVAASIY